MANRLDKVVVVDVEATCWDGAPPPGETSEIIEIGICLLDVASGERGDNESIVVRPEHSTVSDFCTRLTTWTPDEIARGISFPQACRTLVEKYRTRQRLWASYGDYDRLQFERQCRELGVEYPFGATHLNVKNLFAISRSLGREVGMARALQMLGITLEGTHHRGKDDAWNVASILGFLLSRTRDR